VNDAPITVLWAAKGGSGTTTIAASLALLRPHDTLLVDLDGELPAVAGLPEPPGHGVADWLRSEAPTEALEELTVPLDRTTRLLPRGSSPVDGCSSRWTEFTKWAATRGPVVVDAGTGLPPTELLGSNIRSLLVTRACYLSLRRAVASPARPDGVILVTEPGRALHAADVTRAIGVPVVATVAHDPAIARSIDAGILAARIPTGLRRSLTVSPPTPASVRGMGRPSGRGIA
jgi:hypothetical protein